MVPFKYHIAAAIVGLHTPIIRRLPFVVYIIAFFFSSFLSVGLDLASFRLIFGFAVHFFQDLLA